MKNVISQITKNTKNNIFAMPALSDARPPKPNTPAITATIRNTRVQSNKNIEYPFVLKQEGNLYCRKDIKALCSK